MCAKYLLWIEHHRTMRAVCCTCLYVTPASMATHAILHPGGLLLDHEATISVSIFWNHSTDSVTVKKFMTAGWFSLNRSRRVNN